MSFADFLVRLGEQANHFSKEKVGKPRQACDCFEACVYCLFGVGFVSRFVIVCSFLQGHCMIGLRVLLLDNVVTCLDVNMGALMYWHVMSLYVKMAITWLDCECVIA